MSLPSPLAHHSRPWKPLPEKRTARRTGGSLFLSCPNARTDSSHGSATDTPAPFRNIRRVSMVRPLFNSTLFFPGRFDPAVKAELPARRDLHQGARHRPALLERVHHLLDQRLVRQHHRPAERVAQELAAEGLLDLLLPLLEQPRPQAVEALEPGAVLQSHLDVDRAARGVLLAEAADRIVFLHREAEGVDADVAGAALGHARMTGHHLAHGPFLLGFGL